QEEFQCFTAALPHLVSMLIAPEGDPDAPDIPTPRSYAEAIEGPAGSTPLEQLHPRIPEGPSVETQVPTDGDSPHPWELAESHASSSALQTT
ncbi:unnamed protein product, partial [Closterium sp. NIES-54]